MRQKSHTRTISRPRIVFDMIKSGLKGMMVMWRLKSCPRCGGDIYLDSDQYGWYEHCLQCGYMGELRSIVEQRKQSAEKGRDPVILSKRPDYLTKG